MTGYQKFQNLRETLFSKETFREYPELKELSYEELCERGRKAQEWLSKNGKNPKFDEGKRKYNWIVHWINRKKPKEMTSSEIFSYLL